MSVVAAVAAPIIKTPAENGLLFHLKWMREQLDLPGRGALWEYLEESGQRRHGVLIAVDGLQGHLVEALARGAGGDVFLGTIAREQLEGAALQPPSPFARSAPGQQTRFLERVAREGYRHPHYLAFFRRLYRHSAASIAEVGVATTPPSPWPGVCG